MSLVPKNNPEDIHDTFGATMGTLIALIERMNADFSPINRKGLTRIKGGFTWLKPKDFCGFYPQKDLS